MESEGARGREEKLENVVFLSRRNLFKVGLKEIWLPRLVSLKKKVSSLHRDRKKDIS